MPVRLHALEIIATFASNCRDDIAIYCFTLLSACVLFYRGASGIIYEYAYACARLLFARRFEISDTLANDKKPMGVIEAVGRNVRVRYFRDIRLHVKSLVVKSPGTYPIQFRHDPILFRKLMACLVIDVTEYDKCFPSK